MLAKEILGRIAAEKRGCSEIEFEDEAAMKLMRSYAWPGNIREMRNVLERAAQIAQHSPLTVQDLELQHPGSTRRGLAAIRADGDKSHHARDGVALHRVGAGGGVRLDRSRSGTAGNLAKLAVQQGEEQRGGAEWCSEPGTLTA